MSKPRIHVLVVEDDAVDRLACRRTLGRNADTEFEVSEAEIGQEGLQLAKDLRPDCILLDYNLPDLNGVEFLQALAGPDGKVDIPVILLTGAESTPVAVEAMKLGAADYLFKDVDRQYLELLPTALRRVLREQQLRDEKRQAEAQFRTLVEQIQAITYLLEPGPEGRMLYISPQIQMLGYTAEEWLSDPELHERCIHPDDRGAVLRQILHCRLTGEPMRLEYRLFTRDERVLWFRDEAKAVVDESGRQLFLQGILVDITQDKAVEDALRQSRNELRQLAAHQEQLKEEERKRIAQEIHDELGGLLTSIKAYVSVANDRAVQSGTASDPLLTDAARLADTAIGAVRKVITDLRPSVLDQLGIWAALEWYAGQVQERSGIACTCTIDADAYEFELDQERSTMLFRVTQEALTNVVRHAAASRVNIDVALDGSALAVSVKDNGRGIDTERLLNRESWGILGMYERTRHFGGELRITGTPGKGTEVALSLPLDLPLED